MSNVLTTPFVSSVLAWCVKRSPFQKNSRIILGRSGISFTTIIVYALLLLPNHYLSSTTVVRVDSLQNFFRDALFAQNRHAFNHMPIHAILLVIEVVNQSR